MEPMAARGSENMMMNGVEREPNVSTITMYTSITATTRATPSCWNDSFCNCDTPAMATLVPGPGFRSSMTCCAADVTPEVLSDLMVPCTVIARSWLTRETDTGPSVLVTSATSPRGT